MTDEQDTIEIEVYSIDIDYQFNSFLELCVKTDSEISNEEREFYKFLFVGGMHTVTDYLDQLRRTLKQVEQYDKKTQLLVATKIDGAYQHLKKQTSIYLVNEIEEH